MGSNVGTAGFGCSGFLGEALLRTWFLKKLIISYPF